MRWTVGIAVLAAVALSGCTVVDSLDPQPERRGPGAAYGSYLAGSSQTIVVEIDHVPGASFDEGTPAEEQFVDQLERITTKDVEVRTSGELPERGEDYAYAASELRELHAEHQDVQPSRDTEVIHALFLDGRFDDGTLGLAFDTRAFALFKGQIREVTCGNDEPVCQMPCDDGEPVCQQRAIPSTREWKVTRAVATHEAGHLFGLVNSPLPMVEDHEDPEHEGHTTNESSVMFWRLESAGDISTYTEAGEGDEVPWRFGELDVQDARAIQAEA